MLLGWIDATPPNTAPHRTALHYSFLLTFVTSHAKVNMATLEGKVFAITGGASGIGFATAQILSKRGAIVCIADVDPAAMSKAEEHFSSLSVPFTATKVDISKRAEVDSWIDGIVQNYGRLDGAANVAGIIGKHHGLREVADLDDDEWHKIIAVNLTGTMYCLRAELRKIVDGGSIVNVSSVHGLQGNQQLRLTYTECPR